MLKTLTTRCSAHAAFGVHLSRRVPTGEPSSPLLRVILGQNRRSPYFVRRFFCSDSSDGSESAESTGLETKRAEAGEEAADSKSSSAIIPTVVRPEDCLTVIALPLPLPHRPLFPGFYMPVYVKDPKLLAALVENRKRQAPYTGAFLVKDEEATDGSDADKNIHDLKGKGLLNRLHDVGTLAQITSIQGDQVVLIGHRRLRITEMVSEDPLTVKVDHLKEKPYDKDDDILKATSFEVISTPRDVLKTSALWRDHAQTYTQHIGDFTYPRVADFGAAISGANKTQCQEVLEELDVHKRLKLTLELVKKEMEISKIQESIAKAIEEKISGEQRRYLLNEQLKAIKKELGLETDDKTALSAKFRERLDPKKEKIPPRVLQVIEEELTKLQLLEASSSEFNVTRNYLEWLTALPWGEFSDENFDVIHAQKILDEDHYGLTDVKERILEFIAVGKLRGISQGKIICFSGPPGVGKTSIGRSIARALNRKFYRFSVGGLSDVAEIKGHRRTYIGAMPGKMVQCLKSVGTANPLVLIDEIDKIKTEKTRNWGGKGFSTRANFRESKIKINFVAEASGNFPTMYCLRRLSSQPPRFLHTLSTGNNIIAGSDFQSQISSLISGQKWSQLKPIIESSTPADVLRQLLNFNNFNSDCILSFFKWSQHEFQVAYSVENYVKLFILLANDKKHPKLRSLLHIFVNNGESISVSSFCHSLLSGSDNSCAKSVVFDMFILALVNNEKVDIAFEGFRRAGDYGFKLSVVSCNPMLAALVHNDRLGNLEFAYKEMLRRRIQINLFTFNIVINGLCKAGRLNKAKDILEDMNVYGVAPSVVTYNTLIDGYCKKGGGGRMHKCDALLKEMVEKGLSPNVITYNTLINGYCKDDNVAAGIRLLNEMKEQGLKPSVITYNSLINGLCTVGKIDEAMCMKDDMLGMGLEQNLVTYSTFINGFSKNKMMREARELFDSILKEGTAPNVLMFNTLINAYCSVGELDEAVAVFNLMLDKKVSPDVSTYNGLIGAYYRDGNMEEAQKLLYEMEKAGPKADLVTYNIKMDAMCKRGETRKAVRFLDEMSEKELNPSHITYNILVSGYCNQRNPDAALTVKKKMEKAGKRPNVVTYNLLIKAFCERRKLEEANRHLNEMLEKGLVPNQTTYDIIKEEMMEKGFVPDIDGHLYNNSARSSP